MPTQSGTYTTVSPPSKISEREQKLKAYYTEGGFNSAKRIGYVMKLIRELKPLTAEEWRSWYLENVHDEKYLERLAGDMFRTVPVEEDFTYQDCLQYIYEMMFRRTFLGYNKEKAGLQFLREQVSSEVQESPQDWIQKYDAPFYVITKEGKQLLLRLQFDRCAQVQDPALDQRTKDFCEKNNAEVFLIAYARDPSGTAVPSNLNVIKQIKDILNPKPKKLPTHVKIDFRLLRNYIAERREKDMLTSLPFIIQLRTGEKVIVWFQYQVIGACSENLFAHVNTVYAIDPSGKITRKKLELETPIRDAESQDLDFDQYIAELKQLYRKYSVNKMNSLLWNQGYKPLFDASRAVMRELLSAGQTQ